MAVFFTFLSFFLTLSFFLPSHLAFPSPLEGSPNPNPSCPPSVCRELIDVGFPFSHLTNPKCWFDAIICNDDTKPTITFEDGGKSYVVIDIFYHEKKIIIQDKGFYNHKRSHLCNFLHNFTVPTSTFLSFRLVTYNYTFVNCKDDDKPLFNHPNKDVSSVKGCEGRNVSYWPEHLPLLHNLTSLQLRHCSVSRFPLVPRKPDPDEQEDLFSQLYLGFELEWTITEECSKCYEKRGLCRHNSAGNFICPGGNSDKNKKMIIAIGTSTGAGCFLLVGFLFLFIRTSSSGSPRRCWKKKANNAGNAHDVEEFLKIYGSLTLKRYTYSDLKKITNSFKNNLGQGGYGDVFKGMLRDSRLVAVKVLNESKGNGEDFINEVASIGRTYHVNIVSLLGFCSEGSKRALIYEFMPNGSLEKFIYTEKPRESHPLGWENLYQIAIGVARGLEYLHRGCNTRILHFDIKPHNILLDQDFCPKISDFGLAKLCPMQNSTISMLGTRGTVGYIAPEVYCRNIGGVSYKSDVYSYGMMVLEMVGGRKNIDPLVEKTSEIYFPHWIYKRLTTYRHLDQDGYLGLHGIVTKVEEETARKMILVGLWCIQTNPTDRPSMSRVVEMLEGSLDGLQMPPQPFLSSSS